MVSRPKSFRTTGWACCPIHGNHSHWRFEGRHLRCIACVKEYKAKHNLDHPLRNLIHQAKWRAKKANRDFQITELFLKELDKQQSHRCAISGIEFDSNQKPSIDRIDSSQGYVPGNVQLVTIDVNYMKNDLPQAYFVYLCKKVAECQELAA